jgi:CelD/BcsL family acetyltransferase involved in cellulose biosynthesis
VLEAALDALAHITAWDRCILENLPENSNIFGQLNQLAPRLQSRLHLKNGGICPGIAIPVNSAQVLRPLIEKKKWRAYERRLSKLGTLTFRHIEERNEIRQQLPDFFRQHIARRALEEDKSLFCHNEWREFYYRLVDEFDPRTELRFSVLEIDQKPIAYHFGFESRHKFIFYKPTFDIDYWQYSPGQVLIKKLLEYSGTRGLTKFDFTLGADEYKDRLSNYVNQNYTLELFPSRASAAAAKLRHRLAQEIRKHPIAVEKLKKLRGYIRGYFPRAQEGDNATGLSRASDSLRSRARNDTTSYCDSVNHHTEPR